MLYLFLKKLDLYIPLLFWIIYLMMYSVNIDLKDFVIYIILKHYINIIILHY